VIKQISERKVPHTVINLFDEKLTIAP